MGYLIYLFALVVVITAALAGIAVWAPRSVWVKLSALVLSALLMATAYTGLVELLGKPKPVNMEWAAATVPEVTVVAALPREDKAIYLWLRFDDSPEPRAYVVPWSREIAEQLQRATRRAVAEGTEVCMRRPFESTPDANEPVFYAEPQPALPPKRRNAG